MTRNETNFGVIVSILILRNKRYTENPIYVVSYAQCSNWGGGRLGCMGTELH